MRGPSRQQPKSLEPLRPAVAAQGQGGWVYYHGTPDERTWDQPHGAAYGLHVGSEEAARQALNARIGRPLEGDWDGTREYGKTLLSPYQRTGEEGNLEAPRYPSGRATYSTGHPVPMDARPSIFPVRITGPMTNHPAIPMDDAHANGRMKGQITRGQARSGYFYRNAGEDEGSISAVVPSAAHLERVHPPKKGAAWKPSSGIFGPTTGLDQALFTSDGTLRPGVRHDVMTRLDQCIRVDSGLAGSDWQDWTRVYLLGGSVSEWSGERPNGTARDLDVIVAVDLPEAQRHRSFEGMDAGTAASELNKAFHAHFNDDRWHPSFGGIWALTAFCNQRAWDVTQIRPYAAYDLTRSRWAVHPPHLPEHSVKDFGPGVIEHAQAVLAQARAILKMQEPLRSREARDLWEHVRQHRCVAFSGEGTGWDDPGNVDEKMLAYAPRDVWRKVKDLALGPRTASAALSYSYTGKHGRHGFEPAGDQMTRRVTAAAEGCLRNPATGGTEWYHGSDHPEKFDRFDPTRERHAVEEGEAASWWNSRLGTHFTSEHHVATEASSPMGDGNVYHATLRMEHPRHYGSERELDDEAYHWARANGFHVPDSVSREGALTTSPWAQEIADKFRDHLRGSGHDGITYGNEYEGSKGHLCAITFAPEQARIREVHGTGEPCDQTAVCPRCHEEGVERSDAWCPKCEEHVDLHEGSKTAAVQGYLRNPYHGTAEFGGNPAWSQTWFHGTKGEPDFGTRRKFSDEAQRAAVPPEQRQMNSGWTQPNQHLGIHFSPLHEVAHKFVGSVSSTPGSLVHARLRFDDPAVFPSEEHLNIAMADWASKHYPHWHDQKLNENQAWNYGDQEGTRRDFSRAPEDPRERWRLSHKAQDLLTWHPHMPEILKGFQGHLAGQGHHGIVYGNSLEGPYETDAGRGGDAATKYMKKRENWPNGHPYSFSAIAHPDDIEVTHVEHVAPWRTEPESHQRTWEDVSEGDEGDEMRDKVLAWHREHGGKLPLKLAVTASWDTSGSDHSGVYLRFGHWPADERSFSSAGGYYEDGVSAYDLDRHGDPAIDHGLDRTHVHDPEYCDPEDCPLGIDDPDNDPKQEMQERRTRAERDRRYGSDSPKNVGHLVRGDLSGVGYDGEPLLRNVRRVGDWIDHRHLFLDQAQPHPLNRHPLHEDYEEPEEKPPYGYRNRTAPAAPPKTAAASGWQAWTKDEPHRAVINQAQAAFRDLHPEFAAPLDDHRDPDEDWPRDSRPSEEGFKALRHILYDAHHPGSHEGWVIPHPHPEWGKSQPGIDENGHAGIMLHPRSWNRLILAHEAAHIAHSHQAGIDMRAYGHGEGGEASSALPDHVMHGPEFARHYANALDSLSMGAGDEFLRHHAEKVALVGNQRYRVHGQPREFGGHVTGEAPRPQMPPRQEALHYGDASGTSYRNEGLAIAKNPEPGTVLWRSEQRPIGADHGSPETVGIHWTVKPEQVIHQPWGEEHGTHTVVYQARLHDPQGQAIPRSHPMWSGRHQSMDSEAEVRLRPGVHVHVEGAWAPGRPNEERGQLRMLKPDRMHPGDWHWHPVGRDVPVAYKGHGATDYSDVGIHREATSAEGVPQRPKRNPGNAMVYLEVPHGTVQPYVGQEGGHHVALAYLPRAIGDEDFARVVDRAREAATRYPPLRGTLGGHLTFPPGAPSDRRRVAVVPAVIPGVHRLQSEFGEFDRAHYEHYVPHVTRAQLAGNDPDPEPHPQVPVSFTHVHVKRGDEVHSFPLTGLSPAERATQYSERIRNPQRYRRHQQQDQDIRMERERQAVEDAYREKEESTLKPWTRWQEGDAIRHEGAKGYDLSPRSGMIYLDLPPGTVRPVPGGVDDHHVTLVYLGSDVDDEAFEEACRRTRDAAAQWPPMEGVLRGIDIFPPSKSSDGKVVAFVPAYVGGIGALRRKLEDLSASEHKDYRPHVTLAYLGEGDSLPEPHPSVPLRFTHVHVKRGDDVVSFPLTGGASG